MIIRIFEEQLRWSKLAGLTQLKTILEQNVKDEKERSVYELSDGEKSIRDLEEMTGVSRSKIAILWKKWYGMGLMERSHKYEGKRMKKSFSLLDSGIEVILPSNKNVIQNVKEEFD